MEFSAPLVPAQFLKRDNRFLATVKVNGRRLKAHIPNSGRLTELLIPGYPVYLLPAAGSHRKTRFDLTLVRYKEPALREAKGRLVSVDARLPAVLVAEAVVGAGLPGLENARLLGREAPYQDARFDLLLDVGGRITFVETKSVNLVQEALAVFPDAPTVRGRKHLRTLAEVVRQGLGAAVIFVVQRSDAKACSANNETDPQFGEALCAAKASGVALFAYTCRVTTKGISIAHPIPVLA